METLKKQIANQILMAQKPEGKKIPDVWKLQIPIDSNSIYLYRANRDPFEFEEYWQIRVNLPKGYSTSDYEEAVDSIFPDAPSETNEYNRLVKTLSRKQLEDALDLAVR